MRIAFFGTSDKSTPILNVLHRDFDLVLCVTKPDSKVGRKQEARQTAVKKWAQENNVAFKEAPNLKGENMALTSRSLLNSGVALCVVADYDIIIPEEIISTPKFGMINVHFSLLPKYRGASPVQHTILKGEKKAGITFQLIDKGMDTGDILHQLMYPLKGNETTGELYETLFELSASEISEVIKKYESGEIKPTPQNHENATYCYSPSHPKSTYIYKEDAKINWEKSQKEIYNMIRAFNPWPIAWTTLDDMNKVLPVKSGDKKVKIYDADYDETMDALTPKTIQVEGKNKISWADFMNGYGD